MKYKFFALTPLVFALMLGVFCVAEGPSVDWCLGQDQSQHRVQDSCRWQEGVCNAEQYQMALSVIEDALVTFVAPLGERTVMR